MSVLDDLGMREADLAALMVDAPERSLYEQELDAELREEARERQRTFSWDGPTTDEPDGPAPRSGGGAHRGEVAGWVEALRDPQRQGGPVPWERVRAILTEARYGDGEIEAATRSVEVREEAAHRAYTGEPSEEELAERQAAFDEQFGDDGGAILEELAEGLRGG